MERGRSMFSASLQMNINAERYSKHGGLIKSGFMSSSLKSS